MHLTGAHVFTDGQPFTLTASISPLTVYAVFQDTRDPSPRSSPRFVRPRRRGDGQRTVEQAFCNVTSFPSPFGTGDRTKFARSSSQLGRSRSRSRNSRRESLSGWCVIIYTRHGTEGVSCVLKEHFVLLFREYYSRSGMFFASRDNRGFRRVFVLSRPDDLRPPSPCHFNNNNNNSCPICLSEYVSGYLCLGRNRAWCGNGGSLLAKSRGNWMGGVPNGTSFRKLADDQSFIIVAQWINLSGLDKSI